MRNDDNKVREILNKGVLISLCLSTLVSSLVVVIWQVLFELKAANHERYLIQRRLTNAAERVITSYAKNGMREVVETLAKELGDFSVGCAYLEFGGLYPIMGKDISECRKSIIKRPSDRFLIQANGVSLGQLTYALQPATINAWTYTFLVIGFVVLLVSVAFTWWTLLYFLNLSVLRPLRRLTDNIRAGKGLGFDNPSVCTEMVLLSKTIEDLRSQLERDVRQDEFMRVASQVAHDIRSPVFALEAVLSDISSLPEDSRTLIRTAATRIKDISNNLLESMKSRSPTNGRDEGVVSSYHICSLLESLISEKRAQFKHQPQITIAWQMSHQNYALFGSVDPVELKRVISNLVNNAVESIQDRGIVTINLSSTGSSIVISCVDNGKGIPPHILERIKVSGGTYGKKGGTGLGIQHARNCVRAWGGDFQIESKEGNGTVVRIELPRGQVPGWFVPELRLRPHTAVGVLDDEDNIHRVWEEKFRKIGSDNSIAVHSFNNPKDFSQWFSSLHDPADHLYLIDYDLRLKQENGLDLIKRFKIFEKSILVTGMDDDLWLLSECRQSKIRMIPKNLASLVSVQILESESYATRL